MGGSTTPVTDLDSACIEAIQYAIDSGVNVIDTAEMYAAGHTEEIVGQAIRPYERGDLFIITKVWNTHLRHDDLISSARKSLKRLMTDYVDLYLIHWPNSSVPVEETISAMEELVDQGIVRSIGVSNFSVGETMGAMNASGKGICANQIEYNYGRRQAEGDVIPFCEKNNIAVIAYTPIMKGRPTASSVARTLARKYEVNPVQLMLRYTMERSLPIPKSANKKHIDELVEATKIKLTRDDYEMLRRG
jgi:diketogulonate reductase-like aldo/keto reductase